MSPVAHIDVLMKDYSKLCLENFTTGLGPIWLFLHGGYKWSNDRWVSCDKGRPSSSLIFFIIFLPPQSNASLSGRVSPRLGSTSSHRASVSVPHKWGRALLCNVSGGAEGTDTRGLPGPPRACPPPSANSKFVAHVWVQEASLGRVSFSFWAHLRVALWQELMISMINGSLNESLHHEAESLWLGEEGRAERWRSGGM